MGLLIEAQDELYFNAYILDIKGFYALFLLLRFCFSFLHLNYILISEKYFVGGCSKVNNAVILSLRYVLQTCQKHVSAPFWVSFLISSEVLS